MAAACDKLSATVFMSEAKSTSMVQELQALLATTELPALGPEMRSGIKSVAALNQEVQHCLGHFNISSETQAKLKSAALLWHDHLDESHTLSQDIHDRDGSFLHGIMHRREPDASNAKYWFHRVGRHACFPEIARRASALLDAQGETQLKNQLIRHEEWDADAFVDACDAARSPARKQLLQEIQRLEFDVLLEHLCQHG